MQRSAGMPVGEVYLPRPGMPVFFSSKTFYYGLHKKGSRVYLFSIVLVAVLGGLLFGYDTAVISGAEKGLQAFFMGADDFIYTDSWHGITSSSALLGCIIGSALSGFFASRFGRKFSLLFAGIMFFLSALGSYYPEFLFFPYGDPSYSLLLAFNFTG